MDISHPCAAQAPESPEPAPLWLFCRLCDLAIVCGDVGLAKDVAIVACNKWKNAVAWVYAARAFLLLHNFAEAETALAEANIRNPDSPDIWGYLVLANLGQYVLGDASRIDQAAKCLDQARNLFLNDGNILTDVGVAFSKVDRLTLAADVLKTASELPYGAFTKHAKLALARVLAKQNRLVEACDEYATLLTTAKDDEAPVLEAELAPLLHVLGKDLKEADLLDDAADAAEDAPFP